MPVFNNNEIPRNLPFEAGDEQHWKTFLKGRRNGGRVGNKDVELMKRVWVSPAPCSACRKHYGDRAPQECNKLGNQSRCSVCDEKRWSCDWPQIYFRELARQRLKIPDDIFDRLESRWLRETGKSGNPALLVPSNAVRISTRATNPAAPLKPLTQRPGASASPAPGWTWVTDESDDDPESGSDDESQARGAEGEYNTAPSKWSGRPWMRNYERQSNNSDSDGESGQSTLPRTMERPSSRERSRNDKTETPTSRCIPQQWDSTEPVPIREIEKYFAPVEPPEDPDEKISLSMGALYELRQALNIQSEHIKKLEARNRELEEMLRPAEASHDPSAPKEDEPAHAPGMKKEDGTITGENGDVTMNGDDVVMGVVEMSGIDVDEQRDTDLDKMIAELTSITNKVTPAPLTPTPEKQAQTATTVVEETKPSITEDLPPPDAVNAPTNGEVVPPNGEDVAMDVQDQPTNTEVEASDTSAPIGGMDGMVFTGPFPAPLSQTA